MIETRILWMLLEGVLFSTLVVLGWFEHELYRPVPPISQEVRIEN